MTAKRRHIHVCAQFSHIFSVCGKQNKSVAVCWILFPTCSPQHLVYPETTGTVTAGCGRRLETYFPFENRRRFAAHSRHPAHACLLVLLPFALFLKPVRPEAVMGPKNCVYITSRENRLPSDSYQLSQQNVCLSLAEEKILEPNLL